MFEVQIETNPVGVDVDWGFFCVCTTSSSIHFNDIHIHLPDREIQILHIVYGVVIPRWFNLIFSDVAQPSKFEKIDRKVSNSISFIFQRHIGIFPAACVGYEATPRQTLTLSFLLSADSKTEEQPVTSENLRESLKKELEFYFSR